MQKLSSFATLTAALVVVVLAGLNSAIHAAPLTFTPEPFTDDAVTTIYDPTTGNLSVKSDINLTSLQVISSRGLFIPDAVKPGVLGSPFDVLSSSKWFTLNVDGFTDLDIGPIYPAGMDLDAIIADLDVDGSLEGGGGLDREVGSSPHLFIVPEPSGLLLLGMAAIALMANFRRKR